ncbi:MAG TPA: DUF3857 domain-containing protein [Thermomonas sp.]|nr:DUF3857 domain-containing protein [Thermomonas sp.]
MRWMAVLLALGLALGSARADEFTNGGFSFRTGEVPAFVEDRPLPSEWPATAPGAQDEQWRFWRYDRQVDHRPGRDIAYTDYVYEPRSQGNIADAGRFDLSFNPDYQQLTLHRVELRRNGRWESRLKPKDISIARRERQFEQDIADGLVAALIVIEDVRVGDVVRISWSVAGSNPILAGQFSEQTRLAFAHPILDLRLRALYAPGTEIASHRENGAPAPTVSTLPDATLVEVRAAGVDRVQHEDDYPVWYDPYPLVQFGPRRSWADVVAWALPLYPDQSGQSLPADLERMVAQWRRIGSARDRLQAALRVVQDDVRYFGVETGTSSHRPRPPSEVWSRRFGDCKDKTWLLVTVLGRLGIRAMPALVNTERGRGIQGFAPSADVFNHVIVRADIDGRAVYVDPTIRLQGGAPESGDLSGYGFVLPVASGTDALAEVTVPAGAKAGVTTREHYAVDGEGLRLEVATEFVGISADQTRRALDEERIEDRGLRYAEYYGKRFGAIQTLQGPVVEDDRAGNVIRIRETYRLSAPWQREGDTRSLGLEAEALSAVSALPDRTDRKGPLYFARPGRYVQEVSVEAPAGWTPRFAREDAHIASKAFEYRRTLEPSGNGARLRHELEVRQREIPVEQVQAHIGDLRKLREGSHSRLLYRAPASAEAADREARLRSLLQDAMEGR